MRVHEISLLTHCVLTDQISILPAQSAKRTLQWIKERKRLPHEPCSTDRSDQGHGGLIPLSCPWIVVFGSHSSVDLLVLVIGKIIFDLWFSATVSGSNTLQTKQPCR
jgi:hypothetical protein